MASKKGTVTGRAPQIANNPKEVDRAITSYEGMPFSAENTTVYHVAPLGRDIAVASISTYRDKPNLDIRRYYKDDDKERWAPTGKGIRIPLDEAPKFVTALTRIVGITL